MKKKIYTIIAFSLLTTKIFAQCGPSDSVTMGPNYANDVFYSFKNKVVKTEPNTNWHLAFSVQRSQFPSNPLSGVSIRLNNAAGNNVVKLNPSQMASNWRSIDTTGLESLPKLYDGITSWDSSAFTTGYNITGAPFDFKWGSYNSMTNNLTGSRVFVLYNKTANFYKKVFINSLVYDTMWVVTMSNIDNTDSVTFNINKKAYPNKLFVYRNVLTNTTIDREPTNASWDIIFTRYTEPKNPATGGFALTGILSNKSVTVAKNLGKKCNEVWLHTVTAPYKTNINEIGDNWKPRISGNFVIIDTFVYFVVGRDGLNYKLSFNSFGGQATGKTVFKQYQATLGLNDITKNSIFLFPNPTTGVLQFDPTKTVKNVLVTDIKGSMVSIDVVNNTLDLSSFSNGIYHLQINTTNGIYMQKVIKQ